MRAASDAAAIVSLPRSSRAQRLGQAAQQVGARSLVGRVLEERTVAVRGRLPLAGRELHVHLEAGPGWMRLVDEVAGRAG